MLEDEIDWVEAARRLPVAFAQVREDPLIDVELVNLLNRPARVLMIASGGETAAMLASIPCESLHLVDVNPAQLALCRLKLGLLATAESAERLRLLGHDPMDSAVRAQDLRDRLTEFDLPIDALGPPELTADLGPDNCGRYEWLFARLRDCLSDVADELSELLSLSGCAEQGRRSAVGTTLGDRLKMAFAEVMEQSRLVALFGPDATANRVQPFADHFLQQTRSALSSFPAGANPFLHQMLLGRFIGPRWDWFGLSRQPIEPRVQFTHSTIGAVLAELPDRSHDFIHLSNILDWISPTEAEVILRNAYRCLRTGGVVVIRQLNSRLAVRDFSCGLRWMAELSDELLRKDRSFFYRALHVGVRL